MGSGSDVGGDEGSGSWEVGLVVTAARAEVKELVLAVKASRVFCWEVVAAGVIDPAKGLEEDWAEIADSVNKSIVLYTEYTVR